MLGHTGKIEMQLQKSGRNLEIATIWCIQENLIVQLGLIEFCTVAGLGSKVTRKHL